MIGVVKPLEHCLLFSLNSKYTQTNLALHYLQAVATPHFKKEMFTILQLSVNLPRSEILAALNAQVKDVLAVSCYIWNIEITRSVLLALRKIRPEIRIILGGYEVSFDPETYLLEGLGDFVISGEGELKFVNLLRHLHRPEMYAQIDGLTFWRDQQIERNRKHQDIEPLDQLPSPFLNDQEVYNHDFIYYESSRGCVYKCHFCLSALDRGARFFSLDRFFKEMDLILRNQNLTQIKFVDRTFNLNYARTNTIWQYLIKHGSGRNFHFEIAAELLHPSSLELLKTVPEGMFQFEIGVQSVHKAVLDQNGRRCNFDKLEKNLDVLLNQTKVHVHLDLIAGLAGETPEYFKESFNWVYLQRPHHFQIETLKMLKGSIARDLGPEYRMVYEDVPPYSLLQSKDWTYQELRQVEEISALLELFLNRDCLREIIWPLSLLWPSPYDFFIHLHKEFRAAGLGFTGTALKNLYLFLYKLIQDLNRPELNLEALLTLDYLNQYPHGGKTPWPKSSKTLNSVDYAQEVKKRGFEPKGFIEILPAPVIYKGQNSYKFYFGGRNRPCCIAVE